MCTTNFHQNIDSMCKKMCESLIRVRRIMYIYIYIFILQKHIKNDQNYRFLCENCMRV